MAIPKIVLPRFGDAVRIVAGIARDINPSLLAAAFPLLRTSRASLSDAHEGAVRHPTIDRKAPVATLGRVQQFAAAT
jgi:hypothetical protein